MDAKLLSSKIKSYFHEILENMVVKNNSDLVDINYDIQKIIKEVEQKSWNVVPEYPRKDGFYFVTLQAKDGTRDVEYCYFYVDKNTFYLVAEGTLEENTVWEEPVENVVAWRNCPEPYKEDLKEKVG